MAEFRALLDHEQIDAVLSLTPYHEQDALVLWAARSRGIRSTSSIISFDNATTREHLLVRSDEILVWNRYNAAELLRSYPDLDEDRVRLIGAPQFDLHQRSDLRIDRATWCEHLSLPLDRPIILYGAGPHQLVPGERHLIESIDASIHAGQVQGDPYLLVRRHPAEPSDDWTALGHRLRHGRVVDPWVAGGRGGSSWPSHDDLVLQMSSLAHAEVHVNVCSSMTLDGAVFDRPQIGPTFAPGAARTELGRIRSLYRQEHWQPIAQSGGLALAVDQQQLRDELTLALRHPEARRDGRRRMVEDVLTFTDGRATARLVDRVGGSGRDGSPP